MCVFNICLNGHFSKIKIENVGFCNNQLSKKISARLFKNLYKNYILADRQRFYSMFNLTELSDILITYFNRKLNNQEKQCIFLFSKFSITSI